MPIESRIVASLMPIRAQRGRLGAWQASDPVQPS
jgi:hypothetical protein